MKVFMNFVLNMCSDFWDYTFKLIVAWWQQMATEIWVNIGSGNGLLPDGTKPLPEPVLTDHQWSPVTFILGQFHSTIN